MMASCLVTVGMDVERNAVAVIVERRVRRHAAGAGYGFRDRFSRKFRHPALRQSFRSAGGERISRPCTEARAHFRSEENTSELQSLMRISYAVFCLIHKNIKPSKTSHSKN